MEKRLADLAHALGIPVCDPEWDCTVVTGICEDSRTVSPGDLFVAVRGREHDGSAHIAHAVAQGAVAILAEPGVNAPVPVLVTPSAREGLACVSAAFYEYPTRQLFTVGVTGTNGKTTTCHWIAELIGAQRTVLSSTVQNASQGVSSLTTPPSPVIQRLARTAVDSGCRHFVVEASSAGIEQRRVGHIDFDVGVFTNFSPEHRRHHRGLDAYREAKLSLFRAMKPEAVAVLNADDPLCGTIVAGTRARVLTYGLGAHAEIRAQHMRDEGEGVRFTVGWPDGETADAFLPTAERYNVPNALAALAVGEVRGVLRRDLVARLARVQLVPGRAQAFLHPDGRRAIVDFAHNAAALEAVLAHLRHRFGRVVVVFGCPGDGEHEKRLEMGKVAARLADAVVLTADNPHREDPVAIAREIRGGMDGTHAPLVFIEIDRTKAIETAVAQAGPDDVVLIAGKGHEATQQLFDGRVAYSDGAVLQDLGFSEPPP